VTDPPSARIVVVRQGRTPLVNAALADLLASVYPDHEVVDIDVLAELRRRPIQAAAVVAGAAREFAPQLVRRRIDLKRAVVSSSAFTRFVRSHVARTTGRGAVRVVVQSQSLFSAKVPGIPLVVYTDHVHLANLGYPAFDLRRIMPPSFLRRETELYRRADLILIRSTNIRDLLVGTYGVSDERVSVVGVGPNVPRRPPTHRTWHGGRILFVGYDWRRKGGPALLSAFDRLRARHPSVRLDVVGVDGAKRSAAPGVTFHGRIDVDGVSRLLDEADVFCLPTLAEPFGVVFVEAMLAGVPVVGTDLGAQPDFILPGRTGELVAPGDVDELEAALERLVSDPSRTLRLGRAAAQLAADRYDWQAVTASMRRSIDGRIANPWDVSREQVAVG
jgi:glycosyltransferase involved in cell wall biosynthesis